MENEQGRSDEYSVWGTIELRPPVPVTKLWSLTDQDAIHDKLNTALHGAADPDPRRPLPRRVGCSSQTTTQEPTTRAVRRPSSIYEWTTGVSRVRRSTADCGTSLRRSARTTPSTDTSHTRLGR